MGLLLGLEMRRRRHVYDNDDDEQKKTRAMPSNKNVSPTPLVGLLARTTSHASRRGWQLHCEACLFVTVSTLAPKYPPSPSSSSPFSSIVFGLAMSALSGSAPPGHARLSQAKHARLSQAKHGLSASTDLGFAIKEFRIRKIVLAISNTT